jgi:2-methylcitrate dehydratase
MSPASAPERVDGISRWLAGYATGLEAASISAPVKDALAWHLIDSIGCALGGFHERPCAVARRLAASASGGAGGSSVIGLGDRSTAEYAAFANATMVRYLDFNDNYLTNGGGHTSDAIPTLLALAEPRHSSGADLLAAMQVTYEVFAALADAVPMRDRGWDYPAFLGIAAAAGAARILELSSEQACSAISMAITPNLPLGVTRAGELSNWKGLAGPYAAMAATFAARLAAEGITGPPRPFEGVRGLMALATGPFTLERLGEPVDGLTAVERSSYQLYVAEFNAQGPVDLFVQLHDEGIKPDDVESIRVTTYEVAWSEIGGGQDDHAQKWDPQNKETADHSLPYIIAVALADGDVTRDSYAPARIRDPQLRPLLDKISVEPDAGLSKNWVAEPSQRVDVRLRRGQVRQLVSRFPRGHPRNPATQAQLERKFRVNAAAVMSPEGSDELLALLRGIAQLDDVNRLTDLLRRAG